MRGTVASGSSSRPLKAVGGAIIIALTGSAVLWVYYGTTVFFETIRAGFVACFG